MAVEPDVVLNCCVEAQKEVEYTFTVTTESKQEADDIETLCHEHGYESVVHRLDDTYLFIGRYIPEHVVEEHGLADGANHACLSEK